MGVPVSPGLRKSCIGFGHSSITFPGEGKGNPLQCSCLENPRGGGAWWAAVYGVAQSRTRLKWLSSSSSSQDSCLENSIDRGPWLATVHGVKKSQTQRRTHTCMHARAFSGSRPVCSFPSWLVSRSMQAGYIETWCLFVVHVHHKQFLSFMVTFSPMCPQSHNFFKQVAHIFLILYLLPEPAAPGLSSQPSNPHA